MRRSAIWAGRSRSTTPMCSATSSTAALRTSSSTCSTFSASWRTTCCSRSAISVRSAASSNRCAPSTRSIPGATGSVLSRAPYPEFGRIQEVDGSGKSNYNGLSVKLEKRLQQRSELPFRLHLVALDRQRQRHPQPRRRHALPAEQLQPGGREGAVELPHRAPRRHIRCSTSCRSAKGGRWLNGGGVGNVLFGGWQFGSIVSDPDGLPVDRRLGTRPVEHRRRLRPPQLRRRASANFPGDQRTRRRAGSIRRRFVLQPFGTLRQRRPQHVISPGIIQWDASLLKNFHFTEGPAICNSASRHSTRRTIRTGPIPTII